jgi:hypothetical protein
MGIQDRASPLDTLGDRYLASRPGGVDVVGSQGVARMSDLEIFERFIRIVFLAVLVLVLLDLLVQWGWPW